MPVCIATAGGIIKVAATAFVLSWTHSVEKIPWQEHWQASPAGLVLTEARIKGSGAGMDPPEDAVLKDGWYVYHPHIPPRRDIILAASGETVSAWTFCANGQCRDLGAKPSAPIKIALCD
ncbi:DUF1850 domain-containing protein [Ochrobactrum sp. CM-21-5]|nr:DUF1850 domain-containing protein [Ochrobactrum sp. CM-21-5]MBC2886237.1 DUF1850 domain-containing protein [Ochrobactrum sp. CM-21-5]